jgi:hypothetical protein
VAPVVPAASRPLAQRVNQAIDRGLAFLRKQADGLRPPQPVEGLLGLTLLECGTPVNDPLIARLAASLRAQAGQLNQTYTLSTAIFFLDRLGKRHDDELISTFADRLVAGQDEGGSWSYWCPLLGKAPAVPFGQPRRRPGGTGKFALRRHGGGDHSNTQFATLALWIARRHMVSVEVREALARVDQHFRAVQAKDGSWSYHPPPVIRVNQAPAPAVPYGPVRAQGHPGLPPLPDPLAQNLLKNLSVPSVWRTSNTCAGLLALAVGHGIDYGRGPPLRPRPLNDPAVNAALRFLGEAISGDVPVPGGRLLDGRDVVYTLWSVERVGTLYSLQHIGKRAWYPWAAEWLLGAQRPDGSWQHGLGPVVDTCFALLILRRSNLAPDLTHALRAPRKGPAPAPPRRLKEGLPDDAGARRGLTEHRPPPKAAAPVTRPAGRGLLPGLQELDPDPKARDPKPRQ